MSGLLCLKWNNHSPALLKKLNKLRGKDHYCDTTIVCQNKYYPVHKLVLSTCSDYFEDIFEKTQCKHPFIIVKDVEPTELEALLNYMYKGEVNVLQELLPGLIKAAESLQVKGLAVPDDDDESDSQSSSKKIKSREKRSHASSPSPQKKSRRVEDRKSKNTDTHQNERYEEIVRPKVEADLLESDNENVTDTYIEDNLENNGHTRSEVSLSSIKAEPNEDIENMNEDIITDEYSYEPNQNPKEENLSVTEDTSDLLSLDHSDINDQPQCSSWDGIMLPGNNGQSNVALQGTSDEISTEMRAPYFPFPHVRDPLERETYEESQSMEENIADSSNYRKYTHQCSYCNYKSHKSTTLKRHIKDKHTEYKPFQCKFCPYKASRKDDVKRHTRHHTGEKPYKCPVCPFRSSENSNMKKHIKAHSAKIQFNKFKE